MRIISSMRCNIVIKFKVLRMIKFNRTAELSRIARERLKISRLAIFGRWVLSDVNQQRDLHLQNRDGIYPWHEILLFKMRFDGKASSVVNPGPRLWLCRSPSHVFKHQYEFMIRSAALPMRLCIGNGSDTLHIVCRTTLAIVAWQGMVKVTRVG